MTLVTTDKMTHYETLGVEQNAADVDIKRCFRRLSLELHPDRVPDKEAQYKKVVEAYSVLGDVDKRRLYDISLKEEVSKRALTTRKNRSPRRPNSIERDDRYYVYDDDDDADDRDVGCCGGSS